MSMDLIAVSGRPLILIVDDQAINIQILYEALKADYEVCMATSGRQALEFCESRLPDLILLDVVMPDINGRQVCQKLKADERTRDIPIIFVTSQTNPVDEAQALDEGAVDFITKPIHTKVVMARVRTHLTLKFQSERLRSLAMIDGLTGVANRRQFDAQLALDWRQCARDGSALSVAMIDIDFFKRYNDRYGHQAGDACIQAVAATLGHNMRRPYDLIARYGGEEFACILPHTPLERAHQLALRMEQSVRRLAIAHAESSIAGVVTVSVGLATVHPGDSDDTAMLIAEADRMLYAAKTAGRGRVRAGI